MDWLPIDPHHLALLGFVLVPLAMSRLMDRPIRKTVARESEYQWLPESAVLESAILAPEKWAPLVNPYDNLYDSSIEDHMQEIADTWKAEVLQTGQQIIAQIDRKMTALQAVTSEGNRTANRLEVLVEHLEQIAQKQMEQQQQFVTRSQTVHSAAVESTKDEMGESTKDEPAEPDWTVPNRTMKILSNVLPAMETVSLTDVLKEIAEIAEDVEEVGTKIRQSATLGPQPEPETILWLSELRKVSAGTLPEMSNGEEETPLMYELESQEIDRRLDSPQSDKELLLQELPNIDTIPRSPLSGSFSTPFSEMSDDFDFDGFVEADAAQFVISTRTVADSFKDAPAFKMGIVGVGQCGNNLAQAFYRIGYRRVLAVNTAQTDLDSIEKEIPRLLIAKQGAGKDPAVGKANVASKATEIRNSILREFGEDFEKIIVCLGLGGGTGSGGGPSVVKIASDIVKNRGGDPAKDVIAIVTLPDPSVDGPKQCANALDAYKEVAKLDVPMIIIDNAQIAAMIRTPLTDGWVKKNDWIARTFHMFNVYANHPSNLGAFDGNDLNDIISRGLLLFSAFRVSKLTDRYAIGDTMAANLGRSLFAKCDSATATAAGCLMVINPRIGSDMSMEDIAPALKELNHIMRPNSTLHRGIYIPDWTPLDQDNRPDLFCYIIFGGLEHPKVTLEGLCEKAKNIDPKFGSLEAFLAAEA